MAGFFISSFTPIVYSSQFVQGLDASRPCLKFSSQLCSQPKYRVVLSCSLLCCLLRPDKKDKEAAFAEFAAAMDDQLKEQAAAEDTEAEAAAREREEREEYEQQ